jgi:hypothetical protein
MQVALGIVLIALGAAGFFYVNRRVFYRRNVAGIEEFAGYGKMLIARAYEKAVRVISMLFLLVGIAIVAAKVLNH